MNQFSLSLNLIHPPINLSSFSLIHPFPYLPPSQHREKNESKRCDNIIGANDEEKMSRFIINLVVGKHFIIIGVSRSLKII
jgi:hypothetical protein